MHMTGLPWFKPNFKYRPLSIGQPIVKNVIIAEVPA